MLSKKLGIIIILDFLIFIETLSGFFCKSSFIEYSILNLIFVSNVTNVEMI